MTREAEEPSTDWFETVGSELRYDGMYVRVRLDHIRVPDGDTTQREIVEQMPAAGVVPLLDDGRVVLLRQYRHAVGRYLLEIPAGKVDEPQEQPEATAKRELVEETGYRADRVEHLVTFDNSAGWTDERTYLYIATGLHHEGLPDDFDPSAEEADMEVVLLPLAEGVAAVRDGSITDAKTIVGLLLAGSDDGDGKARR